MFTNTTLPPGRTRRSFTRAFKAEIVSQCLTSGESISRIAQEHGLNANLVHNWLRQHSTSVGKGLASPASAAPQNDAFVALQLPSPVTAPCVGAEPDTAAAPTLRIELSRGDTALVIHWPLSHAQASAAWLRQVLA